MAGSGWKLPELQARYRGYFTAHIERLIFASKEKNNSTTK
jgi:hypothetical protein